MDEFSDDSRDNNRTGWFFSRGTLVACITLATVGILLLTGHKAHLLGFAPYLLLIACPLMHLFMHHGQHEHGHSRTRTADSHRNHETTPTSTPEER